MLVPHAQKMDLEKSPAFQFVFSGAADLVFAQSQLSALEVQGQHWVIPQNMYNPIRQDAVLLERGHRGAQQLLDLLTVTDETNH